MLALRGFEETLVLWFERAWERRCLSLSQADQIDARRLVESCSELRWLMPRLLDLVENDHHCDIELLRPSIRILVLEQGMYGGAEGILPAESRERIEETLVDTIIEVLGRVRKLAIASGQWSESPCTPPMCG